MLGAYAIYTFNFVYHLNFWMSLVLSALIVALLGAICSRTIFYFTRGNLLKASAITLGLGMMMRQAVLQGFGTADRGVSSIFLSKVSFLGARLSVERLVVIGYCLLLVGLLAWFLKRTKTGTAMLATNLDEEAAKLQGINTDKIYLIAIALGSGLAGAAGAIVAPILALSSEMGNAMLFMVLMVMILGGMQSPLGAVLGGLLLGLAFSFGFHFLGGLYELATFLLIGIVIFFKPHGLFGRAIEV